MSSDGAKRRAPLSWSPTRLPAELDDPWQATGGGAAGGGGKGRVVLGPLPKWRYGHLPSQNDWSPSPPPFPSLAEHTLLQTDHTP